MSIFVNFGLKEVRGLYPRLISRSSRFEYSKRGILLFSRLDINFTMRIYTILLHLLPEFRGIEVEDLLTKKLGGKKMLQILRS